MCKGRLIENAHLRRKLSNMMIWKESESPRKWIGLLECNSALSCVCLSKTLRSHYPRKSIRMPHDHFSFRAFSPYTCMYILYTRSATLNRKKDFLFFLCIHSSLYSFFPFFSFIHLMLVRDSTVMLVGIMFITFSKDTDCALVLKKWSHFKRIPQQ